MTAENSTTPTAYTATAIDAAKAAYDTAKTELLKKTESEYLATKLGEAEALLQKGTDHIVGSVDPETLAKVVSTIDAGVDTAVETAKPHVAKAVKAYDDTVKTIRTSVSAAKDRVDATVDGVLTTVEQTVDGVLPAEEGEEQEEKEAETPANEATARVMRIRDTASKRFRRRALSGLESLRLRSANSDLGKAVVHLDLLKYSELLDQQLIREKMAATTTAATTAVQEKLEVTRGQVYDLVMAEYEARVSTPVSNLRESAVGAYVEQVQPRVDAARVELGQVVDKASEQATLYVVAPAREYYAVAVAAYAKLKASEDPVVTAVAYTSQVKAALGAAWSDKLVRPTQQLLATLQEEWAKVVEEAEGDGADKAEGVDQQARLDRYFAAIKGRVGKAFDEFKPKAEEAEVVEAEEEEKEFLDAAEE